MRRTTIQSRWNAPRRQYSGNWRHNPWIDAPGSSSRASSGAAGNVTTSVVADSAADRERAALSHSTTSVHDDRQQKAARSIWEDEGGSTRTDSDVRR